MGIALAPQSVIDVYLGKASRVFYEFKNVWSALGRILQLAETLEAANRLLDTQNVNAVIVALDLDEEKTALIMNEIRKQRPYLKVLDAHGARGSSLNQVVKQNLLAIAHGVDGTISVERFQAALRQAAEQQSIGLLRVILGVCGILATLCFAITLSSATGRFLGAFWGTILIVEFALLMVWYQKRLT